MIRDCGRVRQDLARQRRSLPIQGDGIFGRWRYVPKYNVFVAVANSSKNVRSISTLRDAAIDAITAVGPVDYHNRVFSGTLSWT